MYIGIANILIIYIILYRYIHDIILIIGTDLNRSDLPIDNYIIITICLPFLNIN